MDGRRFDELTRSLAVGATSRHRLIRGALAAVAGAVGGLGARRAVEAACAAYGRPCTPANGCCNGATCQGGVCRCPAGASVCNTTGGPVCVACPFGQIVSPGCGCICPATGKAPVGGTCPCASDTHCPAGNICFNGACTCAPGSCGVFPECQGDIDCSCTSTAAGPMCARMRYCDEVLDCGTDADCPPGEVCGLGFCCDQVDGGVRPNTCVIPCGGATVAAAAVVTSQSNVAAEPATATATPTPAPTAAPTEAPSPTPAPTEVPTETPTETPTTEPTPEPTAAPIEVPTQQPTGRRRQGRGW